MRGNPGFPRIEKAARLRAAFWRVTWAAAPQVELSMIDPPLLRVPRKGEKSSAGVNHPKGEESTGGQGAGWGCERNFRPQPRYGGGLGRDSRPKPRYGGGLGRDRRAGLLAAELPPFFIHRSEAGAPRGRFTGSGPPGNVAEVLVREHQARQGRRERSGLKARARLRTPHGAA